MTGPIPVTGKTPIYELEYLLEGEPAFHYRAKMERNSKKLEALMAARALAPPAAVDLAALTGRVTKLEDSRARIIARSTTFSAITLASGASSSQTLPSFILSDPARVAINVAHRAGPNTAGGVVALSLFVAGVFREPQILARTSDETKSAACAVDLPAGSHTLRIDATAFSTAATWTRSDLVLTVGRAE